MAEEKKDTKTTKAEEKKDTKATKAEEKKEEVEVPEKFKDIVEKIENLSVLELSELVKVLEEKLGVSAAAPVATAPVATATAGEGDEESKEKSEYNVEMKDIGDKKIEVIKAVRTITEKGLKEAKELVDSVANEPQIVKEAVPTEEAKEIKKTLEDAGATVELK